MTPTRVPGGWVTLIALLLPACAEAGPPLGPETDEEPAAASLVLVSAGDGIGLVGGRMAEPLIVEARDANGRPAVDVRVAWLATEPNLVCTVNGECSPGMVTRTDVAGHARAWLLGRAIGQAMVVATAHGAESTPVSIPIAVGGVLIRLVSTWLECTASDPASFWGPGNSPTPSIPLGAFIEFESVTWGGYGCPVRVESTEVPPGGTPFDTGEFGPGDRVRVTPNAPGKWGLRDRVTGGTGSLTVLP